MGANKHVYEYMDDLQLLGCENCDAEYPPSTYARCLDTSPSGMDLFGVFQCDACGVTYGVAFDGAAFMAWYNCEMLLAAQAEADLDVMDHQRWKSAIGRQVANFRRTLENVATVEDCWTS